ncbi:hypothetical protein RB597_010325 [Gaeumannomyces tritici]
MMEKTQKPLFLYAPHWDCPVGGPIKLGNIISSIGCPEEPMHYSPPPETIIGPPRTRGFDNDDLKGGRVSILTRFMDAFGAGGGVNTSKNTRSAFSYSCIATEYFVPTGEYIAKCIKAPAVKRFLDRSDCKKPVYIITGLKTAHGPASGISLQSNSRGAHLDGKLDLTAIIGGATPIGMNTGVAAGQKGVSRTSWAGSSDFVLGFRLREVWADRKTKELRKHKDYTKGDFAGNDTAAVPGDEEFSVSKEEDVNDGGHDQAVVTERDDEVVCAFTSLPGA